MYSTASSLRSVPGSTPTTLREFFSLMVLFRSMEAFVFSVTGLKPRWLAALYEVSRSRPASANNWRAASAVSQPCTGMRRSGSSLAGRSYCAPDQEFFTTSQP